MKKGIGILLMAVMLISLAACSTTTKKDETKNVPLADIHTAVKEVYGENYLANSPYDETMVKELFGLNPESYEEVIAEGPMITAHIDTFVAVKAVEGKADEVETALKAYQDKLLADTMQYPMNQLKIKASKVYRKGNYVFFLQLGSLTMEEEGEDEAATIKAFEGQNQLAINAIDKAFE